MSRIFISYSRQDQLFARRLATDLVGLGAELWLDVDDIPAGMNWSSAIQQGLDKCEAMIVVISPYSMSSKNVEDEWQYYLDHNKAIVPVYLATGRMHFQLSRLQYIDFRTAPYETALKELHHELRRLGLKLGPFSAENLSTESNFLDIRRVPPAERAGQLPSAKRNSRLPLIALAILLPILLVIGGLLAESRLFTAQPTPTVVVTALLVAPTTAATATVATVATDAPTQVPTVAATSIPTDVPPTATLAPGAMRTDKAGIEQAWVPAGCFTMGSDPKADPDTNNDEIPAHQVCITKGFWVDLYELSNAAFQKFTDAGGYKDQKYWSADGWKWETVASSNGVLPVNFANFTDPQQPRVGITWYEAEAYAKWRGARLPTEAEWEYAARGPNSLLFPWGNTWDFTKLNTKSGGLTKTTAVNGFPDDKSWVGALNMGGNVREWTADWYDANYYRQRIKNDPPGSGSGTWRVTRGGAWTIVVEDNATPNPNSSRLQARAAYRTTILPSKVFNTIGVRLVSDATP